MRNSARENELGKPKRLLKDGGAARPVSREISAPSPAMHGPCSSVMRMWDTHMQRPATHMPSDTHETPSDVSDDTRLAKSSLRDANVIIRLCGAIDSAARCVYL